MFVVDFKLTIALHLPDLVIVFVLAGFEFSYIFKV
jgi:hypothetical protein